MSTPARNGTITITDGLGNVVTLPFDVMDVDFVPAARSEAGQSISFGSHGDPIVPLESAPTFELFPMSWEWGQPIETSLPSFCLHPSQYAAMLASIPRKPYRSRPRWRPTFPRLSRKAYRKGRRHGEAVVKRQRWGRGPKRAWDTPHTPPGKGTARVSRALGGRCKKNGIG